MSATPRRILYVPNEIGDATQAGYRRAFADLVRAGLLDEVEVVSLERRIRAGGDAAAHRADLVRASRRFRPDLVLMQHVGATGLRASDFAALLDGRIPMLYHEADPYTRWLHPLPPAARIAGRFADLVLTVGDGVFAANFRRAGARRVAWTPHVFDPARIDRTPRPAARGDDVVMIANRGKARIRPLPDAGERGAFAESLQARFGERLALFGRGWSGVGARGPVAYSQQSAALRSAWVSANWDHFADEPRYFSDRLAIALASGSIFATTGHPGYDSVLPEAATGSFLLTAPTPEDLVRRIDQYLRGTTADERLEAENAARDFAWSRLRQDDHLVTMLNALGARIDPTAASEAWDLATAPLPGG